MFMHCRSVRFIPLRCVTACKSNTAPVVLLRFSTSSSRSNSSRFFDFSDILLDNLHYQAYPVFNLSAKINYIL